MKSVAKIAALTRRGMWSYVAILAFSFSLFVPHFIPVRLQPQTDSNLAAVSQPPRAQHQCACELNGRVCQCQGDCCGASGPTSTALCQQLSPLPAPISPSVPPAPMLRDFLQKKHPTTIYVTVLFFLMQMQQKPLSTWLSCPEPPPPRLHSVAC